MDFGVPVVKQENSYYPFGLIMPNSPVAMPALPNKRLYNGGSEWQNDYSNLPDYYQTYNRNYDAALGRFVGVDPEAQGAESMSSYQYVGNNPITNNDPLGNIQHKIVSLREFLNSFGEFEYGANWQADANDDGDGEEGVYDSEEEAVQNNSRGSVYVVNVEGDITPVGPAYGTNDILFANGTRSKNLYDANNNNMQIDRKDVDLGEFLPGMDGNYNYLFVDNLSPMMKLCR